MDAPGKGHGWGAGTGPTTPPAQRGALKIADRVLARIAWMAARDALTSAAWGDAALVQGDPPRVDVTVLEGGARVRVGVDLPFPCDLTAVAVAVQNAVADRVGGLTGIGTREVTVVVERLHPLPVAAVADTVPIPVPEVDEP